MNKVILAGNLGQDPVIRYTSTGLAVANLRMATNHFYRSGNELKKDTQWHSIVAWGPQAERCQKLLTKGSYVLVEGHLVNRKWEDENGTVHWTQEVQMENMNLPPKAKSEVTAEVGDESIGTDPEDTPSQVKRRKTAKTK